MGGFLSKLAGSFGSGALAGGAGSILGGIAGIGGMIQGKKNAKLQRELARKNFELQKEYAEKNYQLQLSQQNMQADQFQTMVDLSDPSNQRAALEKAGFNPFMDGSAIGTPNTPGSSAGSIGQVAAPQYDGTGINQAAALQQQSINNAVGNLNGVLEAAEKVASLPPSLGKKKAELTYQNLMNDLASKQNEEKLVEIAMKKLDLEWLPKEKQANFLNVLANTANLEAQTGLFKLQGDKIEVDMRAVEKQIEKTGHEIEKILAETEGIKKDNKLKDISLEYARTLIEYQIQEYKSQITLNYASASNQTEQASLANKQGIRTLAPQNLSEYYYFDSLGLPQNIGSYNYLQDRNNAQLDYWDAQGLSMLGSSYASALKSIRDANRRNIFGFEFAKPSEVSQDRKGYYNVTEKYWKSKRKRY